MTRRAFGASPGAEPFSSRRREGPSTSVTRRLPTSDSGPSRRCYPIIRALLHVAECCRCRHSRTLVCLKQVGTHFLDTTMAFASVDSPGPKVLEDHFAARADFWLCRFTGREAPCSLVVWPVGPSPRMLGRLLAPWLQSGNFFSWSVSSRIHWTNVCASVSHWRSQ